MGECVIEAIRAADDRCAYARENCNNHEAVPFIHMYFCQVDENWMILTFFTLVFVIVDFHFLSKVADIHLAPSLAYIAKYLRLSETLAGVTLVAFANGSPDALTAFVASSDEEGVLLAIGSIFGAGLFITTVVVGKVVATSGTLKLNSASMTRDIVFNLVGISVIIIYALIGYITYVMSAMFISIYLVYIFVVIYQEYNLEKAKNKFGQDLRASDEKFKNILKSHSDLDQLSPDKKRQTSNQQELPQDAIVEEQVQENSPEEQKQDEGAPLLRSANSQIVFKSHDSIQSGKSKRSKRDADDDYQRTWYETLLQIYEYPFEMIRRSTIPASDDDLWNKYYAICHCILSPVAFLFLIGYLFETAFGVYLIFYFWGFTIPLAILIYFTTDPENSPKLLVIFSVLAAVMGILWVKLCVEMMVDLLKLIQLLTGISYAYIGMTFLALGNSSADFLVNTQVAKLGLGVMAITGCFAGVLFNLLFGFGLGLIRLTWIDNFKGTINFSLFRDPGDVPRDQLQYDKFMNNRMNNTIAYTLILFALINIVMTLVIMRAKDFKIKASVSYYYYTFYIIFFLVITIISFSIDAVVKYLRPSM